MQVDFIGHAQEDSGIKISPSIIEERVEPGQILRSYLYVTNRTKTTQTYYVSKMNMTGLTEKGDPEFVDDASVGSTLSSWISVPVTPIIVSGSGTKEIPFSIQIPVNAPPGGHFAGIFVSTVPDLAEKKNTFVIGVQAGTIVSLRVAGDIKEEAQIRNFFTDKIVYDSPEVNLTAKVENSGNTLVRPSGSIEIFDWFGKKVATLIVNENGGAVLPRNTRAYTTTWRGEGFVLGKYEAHLGLSYGDAAKKTVYTTLTFWVLPTKMVLSIVVGIILSIVIVFGGARAYVRRELHELKGERERTGKKKRSFLRILMVNGGFVLGIIALLVMLLLFF